MEANKDTRTRPLDRPLTVPFPSPLFHPAPHRSAERVRRFARHSALGLAFWWGMAMQAAPIAPESAQDAAHRFANRRYASGKAHVQRAVPRLAAQVEPIQPLLNRWGATVGYAINLERGGYVVLSADDRLPPVKLHSDTGTTADIPPDLMKVVGEELAEDLEEAENPAGFTPATAAFQQQWEEVQAGGDYAASGSENSLATAPWNQNAPYNYYAPTASGGPGGRAYAGCVATQFGIILRYHQLPDRVLKSASYTDSWGTCKGTHAMTDVGTNAYVWANMPTEGVTTSSPTAQQQEIGRLLYHCGVAVGMNFEAGGSGAGTIGSALVAYFDYAHDGLYYRSDYTDTTWIGRIAADIDACRPIAYYFTSSAGGHAVVCDGYRSTNEIHLNFGWGGSGNGWYNLNRVVTGSYTWVSHYALFGITPPATGKPHLTPQKTDVLVALGKNATLSVSVTGDPTPALQWRKSGVAIAGETNATLTLNNITSNDLASYDVVATNSAGSATSATITVKVVPLILTQQPTAVRMIQGLSATMSVGATPLTEVSYQWYSSQGAIDGAIGSTLTLPNVTLSDTDDYRAVVSNPSCSVTSQWARLTVSEGITFLSQPADTNLLAGKPMTLTALASGIDNLSYAWYKDNKSLSKTATNLAFTSAKVTDSGNYYCVARYSNNVCTSATAKVVIGVIPSITTQPAAAKASVGGTLSLTVAATGTAPLSYQWYQAGSAVEGMTNRSLKVTKVQTNAAGDYSVVVQNTFGAVTSRVASAYIAYPPTLAALPKTLLLDEGGATNVSLTVTGRAPFAYTWYRGSTVVGAEATLVLTNLTVGDKGNYKVVVTNSDGKATSSTLTLTLNELPRWVTPPKSVKATENGRLTLTGKASGVLPMSFYWFCGTNAVSLTTNSTLSLSGIQTNLEGNFTVIASNRLGTATYNSFSVYVSDPPTLTLNPTNTVGDEAGEITLTAVAAGREPLTYTWFKSGSAVSLGQGATLTLTNLLPSSAGSYYVAVTNVDGKARSKPAVLSINAKPQWKAQPKSTVVLNGAALSLTASATGVTPMVYYWFFNTNRFLETNAGALKIAKVDTYYEGDFFVIASNRLGVITSTNASVYVKNPPVVTQSPVAASVRETGSFTLTAAATGRLPLTYQWKHAGTPIEGATNTSLTVSNVAAADAGSYWVSVSNVDGAKDSVKATITLVPKPVFTLQPADASATNGGKVTLKGLASGTGVTYQWLFNTAAVSGATAASYTFVLSEAKVGTYALVAKSAWGSVTSQTAQVTIATSGYQLAGPLLVGAPGTWLLWPGATAQFAPPVTGTSASATHQWYQGDTPLPGATNAILTLDNLTAAHAGLYRLAVRDADGVFYSEPGELLIAEHLTPEFFAHALPGQVLAIKRTRSGAPILLFLGDATLPGLLERKLDGGTWEAVATAPQTREPLQFQDESVGQTGLYRVRLVKPEAE